jgi:hypothetical protein
VRIIGTERRLTTGFGINGAEHTGSATSVSFYFMNEAVPVHSGTSLSQSRL